MLSARNRPALRRPGYHRLGIAGTTAEEPRLPEHQVSQDLDDRVSRARYHASGFGGFETGEQPRRRHECERVEQQFISIQESRSLLFTQSAPASRQGSIELYLAEKIFELAEPAKQFTVYSRGYPPWNAEWKRTDADSLSRIPSTNSATMKASSGTSNSQTKPTLDADSKPKRG